MKLQVQARLISDQGKPASRVNVELCTYNSRGNPVRRSIASSNARGQVRFNLELEDAGFQPRLMLRARIGNRRVVLSDTPVEYKRSSVDFGEVSVPAASNARTARAVANLANARKLGVQSSNLVGNQVSEVAVKKADPKMIQSIEAPLQKRIAELQKEKAEAESQLEKAKKPLLQEIEQLKKAQPKVSEVDIKKRVDRAVLEVEANLKSEIQKRDEKIEELSKAGMDQGGELQNLLLSSQNQLKSAQDQINQTGGRYKLGKVSFNTKVIPNEKGTGFRLPTAAESKELRDILTDVSYDLAPADEAEADAPVPVPDLTGLTESMARVRARQSGLEVDVRSQAVPADSDRVGQVVRQMPASGKNRTLPQGGALTVLIGRPMQPST